MALCYKLLQCNGTDQFGHYSIWHYDDRDEGYDDPDEDPDDHGEDYDDHDEDDGDHDEDDPIPRILRADSFFFSSITLELVFGWDGQKMWTFPERHDQDLMLLSDDRIIDIWQVQC